MAKTLERRELEEWIDLELAYYVKEMIADGDYVMLRRNLIQIADAYAKHVVARERCRRATPRRTARRRALVVGI